MSALDDLPTPELGSPVQRRGRWRRGSDEPIGTLEDRVAGLERDHKTARGRIGTALVAALGSAGAVLIWALNAREAAGGEKVRAQVLDRDVERLRVELEQLRATVYRLSAPWRRNDRTDQPDPPARKDSDP